MSNERGLREPLTSRSPWRRLRGVVVEFVVIVTGVLVALAVDQWRADREDSELASFYLATLENDLRADSANMAEVLGKAESVRASAQSLETALASGGFAEPNDFLVDVTWLLMQLEFRPATAGFDDVTGSGNLRLIRDRELRNRLQSYVVLARATREAILENGRDVGRNEFPLALLEPPLNDLFEERLSTSVDDQAPFDALGVDANTVLAVLRSDPGVLGWLRRRRLHAAYVIGDLGYKIENEVIPMLRDLQRARAGLPLTERP